MILILYKGDQRSLCPGPVVCVYVHFGLLRSPNHSSTMYWTELLGHWCQCFLFKVFYPCFLDNTNDGMGTGICNNALGRCLYYSIAIIHGRCQWERYDTSNSFHICKVTSRLIGKEPCTKLGPVTWMLVLLCMSMLRIVSFYNMLTYIFFG